METNSWIDPRLFNLLGNDKIKSFPIHIIDINVAMKFKSFDTIEINLGHLKSEGDQIQIGGMNCIVYIKNQVSGLGTYKYHFYNCPSLTGHLKAKERFVATRKTSGKFLVVDRLGKEKNLELFPCGHCIRMSGFSNNWRNLRKTELGRKEFISFVISESNIGDGFGSEYTSEFTYDSGYVENWAEISNGYKKSKDWICECCSLKLKRHKHLCHTHHIDKNKLNNLESNFLCLCVECHSKQPNHNHMLKNKQFQKQIEFIKLLRG